MKIQITYAAEEAYRNEILERNPIANIAWKTYAGISARRFAEKIEMLRRKNMPSQAIRPSKSLLEMQKRL